MEDSMKHLISMAAAFIALSVAAPALAAPADPPCLQVGQVYDFKPVPGNRSLIVIDRLRHKYKVNFMGVCSDLQFNLGLGFKSFGTGRLSCLTKGDYVISHDPARPMNHCIIQNIQPYTAAMERADAAARKAKTQ
jgi:hypothetical protein